jgi:hypothetical protein
MAHGEEGFSKRDRAARLTRVATLLYQHRPYGLTAREIARRIDVNVPVHRQLPVVVRIRSDSA